MSGMRLSSVLLILFAGRDASAPVVWPDCGALVAALADLANSVWMPLAWIHCGVSVVTIRMDVKWWQSQNSQSDSLAIHDSSLLSGLFCMHEFLQSQIARNLPSARCNHTCGAATYINKKNCKELYRKPSSYWSRINAIYDHSYALLPFLSCSSSPKLLKFCWSDYFTCIQLRVNIWMAQIHFLTFWQLSV